MTVVFLDIETVPTDDQKIIRRLQDGIKPPGQYKKEDSIKQWWASEGAAAKLSAVSKTALDGTYGKVAVIGVKVDDEEAQFFTTESATEAEVLDEFTAHVRNFTDETVTYVAHNAAFDLRFLYRRSKILQAPLPQHWPLGRYDANRFCTMEAWCGYGEYIKQAELESVFGIERPSDITGADVATLIEIGDYATVVKHCRYDIDGLEQIYRRLTACHTIR